MSCACCGHATNSYQRNGLCSGCAATLSDMRWLKSDVLPHVLIRAAGGSMKDAARATGTTAGDNDYALKKAMKALGCSREHLLLVARYGQATHRLEVPPGFERPTYETPTHEPPKPKLLERVVIETPAPRPVVVEHREPVRMLTDRAEDAPLTRAVTAINQATEEEKPMGTTDVSPEQQAKSTERLETLGGEPLPTPVPVVAAHLLTAARSAAHDAGMDYQVAFAELAHLVLTGDSLPDMGLVKLAYVFGEAKGRLAALEALA